MMPDQQRPGTKLAGTAVALAVIAVGAVLEAAVQSALPGLLVMLAGVFGLAVVLIRSVGNPDRTERPRRAETSREHDPDRAYFDALREVPTTATVRDPAAPRPRAEDRESQGSYSPRTRVRPEAGQR